VLQEAENEFAKIKADSNAVSSEADTQEIKKSKQ
jgi:hypothetical protein